MASAYCTMRKASFLNCKDGAVMLTLSRAGADKLHGVYMSGLRPAANVALNCLHRDIAQGICRAASPPPWHSRRSRGAGWAALPVWAVSLLPRLQHLQAACCSAPCRSYAPRISPACWPSGRLQFRFDRLSAYASLQHGPCVMQNLSVPHKTRTCAYFGQPWPRCSSCLAPCRAMHHTWALTSALLDDDLPLSIRMLHALPESGEVCRWDHAAAGTLGHLRAQYLFSRSEHGCGSQIIDTELKS